MRRKLVRAGITTIALTTVAGSAMAGSPAAVAATQAPTATDPDPAASGEADLTAKDLAARRGITLAEAQRRISWQARAPKLGKDVSASLGAKFGGLWIDGNSDRLKVGVVGDGAAAVRTAAAGVGLAEATDSVPVRFSWTELQAHNNWLGMQIASVNTSDATVMLSAGIRTDRNTVQLHVPASGLTAAQQALVDEAKKKIGAALSVVAEGAGAVEPASCALNRCDPPLRGGVRIENSLGGGVTRLCTSGFTGQDANGTFYLFTAGHCVDGAAAADTWTTEFTDGSTHAIGPKANSVWNTSGDAAVLRVNNPSGWKLPSATIQVPGGQSIDRNENYKITSDGGFAVNQTICVSGATTVKNMCGSIKEVDQTVAYGGHTVRGLAQGTACVQGGDSGGPVFSANKALGLIVAVSTSNGCVSFYQPIQTAEKLLGVSVLHA